MTILTWIIIAAVIVFLVVLILLEKTYLTMEKKKISFKESIDLTGLPVVTFLIGKEKLNFILDTGANMSYINKEIIDNKEIPHKKVSHEDFDGSTIYYGIEGKSNRLDIVILELSYKDRKFPNIFGVSDFSEAFDRFKRNGGVTVHGLIGCDFFEKYKYVIDFAELKAYPK